LAIGGAKSKDFENAPPDSRQHFDIWQFATAVSRDAVERWTKDARAEEKCGRKSKDFENRPPDSRQHFDWTGKKSKDFENLPPDSRQRDIAEIIGKEYPAFAGTDHKAIGRWVDGAKSKDFENAPPDSRQHFDIWQFATAHKAIERWLDGAFSASAANAPPDSRQRYQRDIAGNMAFDGTTQQTLSNWLNKFSKDFENLSPPDSRQRDIAEIIGKEYPAFDGIDEETTRRWVNSTKSKDFENVEAPDSRQPHLPIHNGINEETTRLWCSKKSANAGNVEAPTRWDDAACPRRLRSSARNIRRSPELRSPESKSGPQRRICYHPPTPASTSQTLSNWLNKFSADAENLSPPDSRRQ
jgi:hypothetical protein